MAKMSSFFGKSNRKTHRTGKNISIYLRGEELELLDLIGKAYGMNRSETIQFLLKQIKELVAIFIQQKPELIKAFLEEQLKDSSSKQGV